MSKRLPWVRIRDVGWGDIPWFLWPALVPGVVVFFGAWNYMVVLDWVFQRSRSDN